MSLLTRIGIAAALVAAPTLSIAATHSVSTWQQFRTALSNVNSGDIIELAPGTYKPTNSSNFNALDAGTMPGGNKYYRNIGTIFGMKNKNNILIRGTSASNRPVLRGFDGSAPNYNHYGFYCQQCNGLVMQDLIVEKVDKGIVIDRSDNVVIQNVEIRDTTAEGLHLRDGSDRGYVANNTFKRIGLARNDRGEAIYICSDKKKWHVDYMQNNDDHWQKNCDDTVIEHNNIGPDVGADHVDIKEGTKRTKVRGNTFIAKTTHSMMTGEPNSERRAAIVHDKGRDGHIIENDFNLSQANWQSGTVTAIRVDQILDCPEDQDCDVWGHNHRSYKNSITNAGSAWIAYMPSHGSATWGCDTTNTNNKYNGGSGSKGSHSVVSGGSCWSWNAALSGGKTYKIINRGAGRALAKNSSTDDNVKSRNFDNNSRHKWKAESAGGGYYYLKNMSASNKYLYLSGSSFRVKGKQSNDNFKFKSVHVDDGSYKLIHKQSGKIVRTGSHSYGSDVSSATHSSSNHKHQWFLVQL